MITDAELDLIAAKPDDKLTLTDLAQLRELFVQVRKQSLAASRIGDIRLVAKLSAKTAKINSVLQREAHAKEAARQRAKAVRYGR